LFKSDTFLEKYKLQEKTDQEVINWRISLNR
jgi:hypothetical protein